ncbi:hypothetical protein [Oenococcus sp.]|uniref:hypothetical protein n=1 Tax=Oenococcus sp. TaxID=1979414 RepID=UPI0039E75BBE
MSLLFDLAPFLTVAFGFLNFYILDLFEIIDTGGGESGVKEEQYWSWIFGALNFALFLLIKTVWFPGGTMASYAEAIVLTFVLSLTAGTLIFFFLIKLIRIIVNLIRTKGKHVPIDTRPLWDKFTDVQSGLIFIIDFDGKVLESGTYDGATDFYSNKMDFLINQRFNKYDIKEEKDIEQFLSKNGNWLHVLNKKGVPSIQTYFDTSRRLKYMLVKTSD